MTNRIATALGAAALSALASACGGAPAEITDSLTASCQVIDKATPAVCACQTDVLASNMDAKSLEIYAFYRAEWAKNEAAYNSVELGENAAIEKFKITKKEMTMISNEAALKYRADLKACESKT